MSKSMFSFLLCLSLSVGDVSGYAFVPSRTSTAGGAVATSKRGHQKSSLQMVDQNVIMGAGVAAAGLGVGIGLVAFTESQGERAKARGSGISDKMSTQLAGALLEDVEVSSVDDLGSLTSQLENALKETGAAKDETFEMTEEEKKRIAEEADDGW